MCNFCSKGADNESLTNLLDVIIYGNELILEYDAYSVDSSFYEEIQIRFCPMCGKSLEAEKAKAEPKPETTEEKVIAYTLQRIEEMERQGYSPFRINEEILNHQP